MQFEASHAWIPTWGITYHLGVDGTRSFWCSSRPFTMPLAVLGSYTYIKTYERPYYALLMVPDQRMLGVFLAQDLFVFYVFWKSC